MIEPNFAQDTDDYANGTYTAWVRCTHGCGRDSVVKVRSEDVYAWRRGASVQQTFPYLTPQQREAVFISGVCPTCWVEMFPDEDA